jgi:hypothetical protein
MKTLLALALLSEVSAFNFTDVTSSAGITHLYEQHPDNLDPSISLDMEFPVMMGGAVAEDFDGDGWEDLYVLQGGLSGNVLYINQQDGTFVEEAAARGADQVGLYTGVSAADYDSDGDVDLFVSVASGPHLLLTNDGSGHFTSDTTQFTEPSHRSSSPSWADVNGDGQLDVALGAWESGSGGDIQIYWNRGSGQFELVQVISIEWQYVPHFVDLNEDGHVDLVAVADFGFTKWYLNNGDGIFLPEGTSDIQNGMGVASGDPDNDGDMDLFITAIRDPADETIDFGQTAGTGNSGNRLLINDGHGEFTDVTSLAGVRSGYWGWGTVFGDFDNDGDEDIYQVNGWPSFVRNEPFANTPNLLFENQGALSFVEVGESSGDAADTGQGRSAVAFDYDHDGDLDLFVFNSFEVETDFSTGATNIFPRAPVLLRNDTASPGNWLKVQVAGGATRHAHGMGARINASVPGRQMTREINASSNYNGHGPYRIAHFGAGASTSFDEVRVTFPNRDQVWRQNVAANQSITMKAPEATLSARTVDMGGSINFEWPSGSIPEGAVLVWEAGGDAFTTNPATLTFNTAGTQTVTAYLYSGSSRSTLLHAESYEIEVTDPSVEAPSIARIWNEATLDAIRLDFPNPAVHARNLFHLSVVFWDVWAAYDAEALGYIHRESQTAADIAAARHEAISYGAYRLLHSRYAKSENASTTQLILDLMMEDLGYDTNITSVAGDTPAALGNRVAAAVMAWGDSDGAREDTFYDDPSYSPVNSAMLISGRGTTLNDPNRWQPLRFNRALTQNGLITTTVQIFVGSHWGWVRPFALAPESPTYLDPGMPPQLGGENEAEYKQGNIDIVRLSSWLDPDANVMIDISPRSVGLNTLGQNDGEGHGLAPNPYTGEPYEEQVVNRADYGRAIAEFWADGPESETPPGHWNTLANYVSDHPDTVKRFKGEGEPWDDLEWDVKLYFALNAALHDAAIAAWGCKRVYDYIRPISAIRHLSGTGGFPEVPGLIERITSESSAPGERHAHLIDAGASIGDTAIYAWGGEPSDPNTEYTGSQWILGEDWLPYQRDTFVTPAFAGYVSGHSAFSRAAAEVLTYFTGTPYFPGGLGVHHVPQGSFEFEYGPSSDLTLQWATYYDAADEAGLSRLYGGIHVPVDDGPGRIMGSAAGGQAMARAEQYYDGTIISRPILGEIDLRGNNPQINFNLTRGLYYKIQSSGNLVDWNDETSFTQALEDNVIVDITMNETRRFYRVVQQTNP